MNDLLLYEQAKDRVLVRLLTSRLCVPLGGKRVLDIGCSTGALMQLLETKGADVFGVDVDSPWSAHYCYKPEKRILLDIQESDLPVEWEKKGFSIVIAQEVIEHIMRPYDFLRRIWRVLDPGGYLFLTTPNLVGITAFLKGNKWCGIATQGHVLLYSPKSLDFTVCNCGFRRLRTFTNLIPIAYQDKHRWLRWLNCGFIWTGLGGGLIGLYEKVGQ
jgi:2-polyprenyl-3-methyl-5-hydroxy-6-metoxy-1,4-benzoquinol methylase